MSKEERIQHLQAEVDAYQTELRACKQEKADTQKDINIIMSVLSPILAPFISKQQPKPEPKTSGLLGRLSNIVPDKANEGFNIMSILPSIMAIKDNPELGAAFSRLSQRYFKENA